MSSSQALEIKVELKYCECCGGLWIRPANGKQVYCVSCRPAMEELAVATPRAPRRRKKRAVSDRSLFDIQGVAVETSETYLEPAAGGSPCVCA